MSRQTFVAIRYSQARNSELPSNVLAAPPGAEERLLHGVLGLVERGEHAVAVDVQLAPMALGERREGGFRRRRTRPSVTPAAAAAAVTSWTSQVLPSGSWNEKNVS